MFGLLPVIPSGFGIQKNKSKKNCNIFRFFGFWLKIWIIFLVSVIKLYCMFQHEKGEKPYIYIQDIDLLIIKYVDIL